MLVFYIFMGFKYKKYYSGKLEYLLTVLNSKDLVLKDDEVSGALSTSKSMK